jgi:hypothetical protein
MTTTNLNLTTFNAGVDPDESFENYRMILDGPTNSNMTKIDTWAMTVPLLLASVLSETSASITTINNFITNATGSAIASASLVHSIETFFIKLGEFSGSGQANFTGISQAFNHILIIGIGAGTTPLSSNGYDVGIDFNGDSGSSKYSTMQWWRGGSVIPGVENIGFFNSSQITIGEAPTSNGVYGSPIMAIIPYYSGSSGFYKTAMGFSSFVSTDSNWFSSGIQGGVYTSTSPITRIRVFINSHQASGSITRDNFLTGTKISLYGFI